MIANIAGPPVSGDNLFGRDHEIATLWERLENNQHILLLAPRRVGKTSLMHELRRAPRDGWIVFYSELEGCTGPADCVAHLIAHLASNQTTRTWLETIAAFIPFKEGVRNALSRVTALVVESVRVELKGALIGEWTETAERLRKRLAALPSGMRILFILDEFPILLSTILREPEGPKHAGQLLGWLRGLRQDPELVGKVSLLVGGSIGLQNLLRRYNMSAPINDFLSFRVEPWSDETASAFLERLGRDNGFPVADQPIDKMLSLLGEAVPYHVQLLFQAARDICGGDVSRLDPQVIDRAFSERLAGPLGGPHLDHYAERLERVLPPEDVEIARGILARACQSERGMELAALADLAPGRSRELAAIHRLLIDDGYLIEESGSLRFRSNLVRDYWRNHQALERQP